MFFSAKTIKRNLMCIYAYTFINIIHDLSKSFYQKKKVSQKISNPKRSPQNGLRHTSPSLIYLGQWPPFGQLILSQSGRYWTCTFTYSVHFFFKSVVVVEEIHHLKCQLESDISSPETILSALKMLGSKNVSKDVLLSTKIGHTVNRLRRQGSSDEIREQAKLVFRRWRRFIRDLEREKPLIEVHCDKKTEVLRGKARQLLADNLQVTVRLCLVFRCTVYPVNHLT